MALVGCSPIKALGLQRTHNGVIHSMRQLFGLICLMSWAVSSPSWAAISDFPRPAALEPQIQFWTNIFTKYSVHQAVIHDDLLMDKVHQVLDFSSLDKSGVSQATYWRNRKASERTAKADIVAKLHKIQRVGGDRSQLTKSERHLRDRYAAYTSQTKYSNAADRVRSQGGLKERFREAIIVSGRYLPYMENVFRREGLPIELTRLPFVESSFNLNAYSSVAAAGIWQFMPASGRMYKLRQNDVVDDRRDPWFSTHAAAKHLKDDYARLKDWGLAVTAYNHGRAGVARAVKSVNGSGIEHVVKQYKGRRFGFASRNFYTSFVAAMYVVNDSERYFGKLNRESSLRFDEVRPKDYVEFGTLASLAGVNVAQFAELNPAFLSAVRNGKLRVPPNYLIRVPYGRAESFNQKYAALGPGNHYRSQKSYYVHHKVRNGESLGGIAQRYGSSVRTIMRTNKISSANRIRVGQVLKIPSSDSRPAKASAYASASSSVSAAIPTSSGSSDYVVSKGDTLGAIAQRHGTSTSALMRANGITDARHLRIGQRLSMPGSANSSGSSSTQVASSSSAATSYVVKSGDVLGAIAKRHGVSVSDLMQANNLRSAHQLKIGQQLEIPGSGPAYVSHKVQRGQTLSAIAKRYGTSVRSIQSKNNLNSAHSIRVGQVLSIPTSL